ncbi:MAG: hypothetical protein EOP94_01450, partial [Zymomonas sp.]
MAADAPPILAERPIFENRTSERVPMWALAIPATVLCFLVLPHAYGRIAFGPQYMLAYPGPFLDNVLLNCAGNFAVIVLSAHLKDRLDRKLAAVLSRAVIIHGMIALTILLLHLEYSNQTMILGMVFSAVLGPTYMYLEHVIVRPRIAIIGEPAPGALARLSDRYKNDVRQLNDPEKGVPKKGPSFARKFAAPLRTHCIA